ncbi:hypothetical protein FACS1894159_01640 [Bacteroidia bacterium]|nr:hypothetical protein FACS1894159_01640 [Bacteroidia bacterium]
MKIGTYFLLFALVPGCALAAGVSNGVVKVTPNASSATISVEYDGRKWDQQPVAAAFVFKNISADATTVRGNLAQKNGTMVGDFEIAIDGQTSEFSFTTVFYPDTLSKSLFYPYPFSPRADDCLVLPYREGIRVRCDDSYLLGGLLARTDFSFTEGHNFNMPWWGLEGAAGGYVMAVVETPFDARIKLRDTNGLWSAQVNWLPQMGKFGDRRTIRYILGKGGYADMCKRFRLWAQEHGYVRTLKEKLADIPATDDAVGGPVIYVMTGRGDAVDDSDIVADFIRGGVTKGTFYGGGGWYANMSPRCIKKVNAMGFVTSRYDIITDFVPDVDLPLVNVNPNWPKDATIREAAMTADGAPHRNWRVKAKDGSTYKTYSLCDLLMKNHFKKIDDDLAVKSYSGWFIDVLGAVEVRECYHPDHRATREESVRARAEVLGMLYDRKLVVGTEAGNVFMLKNCHLFEGLRSVHPLTMHDPKTSKDEEKTHWMWDAGKMLPEEELQMLMTSQRYIVPLWQLAFGDCVLSYIRWNQQTNRYLDAQWVSTHQLFSILTGQGAMISVPEELWSSYRKDIVAITKRIFDANQPVRYALMTGHGCLDKNRDVHYSDFDNGMRIIVNFSQEPFTYKGRKIDARDYILER